MFPVKFAKFLRTPILENICEWMFLKHIWSSVFIKWWDWYSVYFDMDWVRYREGELVIFPLSTLLQVLDSEWQELERKMNYLEKRKNVASKPLLFKSLSKSLQFNFYEGKKCMPYLETLITLRNFTSICYVWL